MWKFHHSHIDRLAYSAGHNDVGDKIRAVVISIFMILANKEVESDVKKAIESNQTEAIGKYSLDLSHLHYACKVANDETVKFISIRTRHYPLICLLFAKNGRLELMKWFYGRKYKVPTKECKAVTENKDVLDWLNSL